MRHREVVGVDNGDAGIPPTALKLALATTLPTLGVSVTQLLGMRGVRSERRTCALVAVLLCFNGAIAHSQAPEVTAIDVYGTDVLDVAVVQSDFEGDIEKIAAARMRGDWSGAAAIEARVAEQLMMVGDFASIQVSLLTYSGGRIFATIDVVESADLGQRAPFHNPPTDDLVDPGGLVSMWREYEKKFLSLLTSNDIEEGECEALHCLAAFRANRDLHPYLEKFDEAVETHEDALYEVARRHRYAVNRGAAVYLLAHSADKSRLLRLLGEAMFDGDAYVRNNAMRVIAQMIEREPHLPYPLDELVRAMDFPVATDRNKATVAVAHLAKSQLHRERIRELAIPTALRLLRQQQPINHEPAYELLKNVSGQAFPPRDYGAWERFFGRQ